MRSCEAAHCAYLIIWASSFFFETPLQSFPLFISGSIGQYVISQRWSTGRRRCSRCDWWYAVGFLPLYVQEVAETHTHRHLYVRPATQGATTIQPTLERPRVRRKLVQCLPDRPKLCRCRWLIVYVISAQRAQMLLPKMRTQRPRVRPANMNSPLVRRRENEGSL